MNEGGIARFCRVIINMNNGINEEGVGKSYELICEAWKVQKENSKIGFHFVHSCVFSVNSSGFTITKCYGTESTTHLDQSVIMHYK